MRESSLLGVGPENFILGRFKNQFDPAFYSYERSEVWFDHAHHTYIDMLVTHGWAGFAYLFKAVYYGFYTIISLYTGKENSVRRMRSCSQFYDCIRGAECFLV